MHPEQFLRPDIQKSQNYKISQKYKNELYNLYLIQDKKLKKIDFPKFSNLFPKVRKCFGVFVKQIVNFNIGFGFCVFNSIWEQRLKIFFDPQNRKSSTPEKSKTFPSSKKMNIYKYINI